MPEWNNGPLSYSVRLAGVGSGSEANGLNRLMVESGIELSFSFIKSRVFTALPTASQMNWSQMELL